MNPKTLCRLLAGVIAIGAMTTASHAALSISNKVTKDVTCTAGVCTATGKKAVLNASDLMSMLGSGDLKVVPGNKAVDIDVAAPVAWGSSHNLTLDARRSISAEQQILVQGTGGLTLTTNDGGSGGTLTFSGKGNVTFVGLSNSLTINGVGYTLVGSIATLASKIVSNPSGNFALASSYNAKADGKYKASPIATTFTGAFEGLGNTISNLSIDDATKSDVVGLFAHVGAGGSLRDVGLAGGKVIGGDGALVGELVGSLFGSVVNSFSSGTSTTGNSISGTPNTIAEVGGLIGMISATAVVANSYSTAAVTGGGSSYAGGLIGEALNGGTIQNSSASGNVTAGGNTLGGSYTGSIGGGLVGVVYDASGPAAIVTSDHATGSVTSGANDDGTGGGLIGAAGGHAAISLSYATGAVTIGAGSGGEGYASGGGLLGSQFLINNVSSTIDQSFAMGAVKGAPTALVGGLVGQSYGSATNSYATGAVSQTGTGNTSLGGLVGFLPSVGTIATSYSTGQVQLVANSYSGGAIGYNIGSPSTLFWDTTTSGVTNLAQGCGNISNCPGVTGYTTEQLQSGIPSGFNSSVWAENANINGGLPYLIANPPPS